MSQTKKMYNTSFFKMHESMKNTKLLLVIFVFSFSSLAYSQDTSGNGMNTVTYDKQAEQDILIGECNRDAFTIENFVDWYITGYKNYEVTDSVFDQRTKERIRNVKYLVVMATWCPDSKREVPHFLKILDNYGVNNDNVRIVSLNTEKEAPDFQVDKYNIRKVPTFIIKSGEKELGRITESPEKSLETSLVQILK